MSNVTGNCRARLGTFAFAGLLALSLPGAALASPAVVSFDNPAVFFGQSHSVGYEFTTATDLAVSALGYYDSGLDGLVGGHGVGIFDLAGNLLASTTVDSTAYLVGDFRYIDLGSALNLIAGNSYRIAGTTAGDQDGWVYQAQNIATNGITYDGSYFTSGAGLLFPTQSPGDREYMTVNFLQNNEVPEPSTWAMMLLGFGAAGYAMRRRKSQWKLSRAT